MIILEGPDNAGKSTLGEYIANNLNIPMHHAKGPPKSHEEIRERQDAINNRLAKREWCVTDRTPVISDNIYGAALSRDRLHFTTNDLATFFRFRPLIIYCRPPFDELMKVTKSHKVKDHETKAHVDAMRKNAETIVALYDNFFQAWSPHTWYDWTGQNWSTRDQELMAQLQMSKDADHATRRS
jgi:adenylate kinase family enzyme